MELLDLIKSRYSVRAYKPDPVEEDALQQVLEAARLAPTASNRQPFQLIVVHTAGREADLRRIYDREWFVQAPLILCACGLEGQAWVRMDGKNYADVDVAIVMDHMILTATDLGLGTCWIAAFNPGLPATFWVCPRAWSRSPLLRWDTRQARHGPSSAGHSLSWCVTSGGEISFTHSNRALRRFQFAQGPV